MKIIERIFFFVFVLILILATSTSSTLVENLFGGGNITLSSILLVVYILVGSVILRKVVKGSLKLAFSAVLCIVAGLISLFTLEHIIFEGGTATKFIVLLIFSVLFLLSLLKSMEESVKQTKTL